MKTSGLAALLFAALWLPACGPKSQPVSQEAPPEKATVNGQVFIATRGGDNIKLALVHVHLYSLQQAMTAQDQAKKDADSSDQELQPEIDAQKKLLLDEVHQFNALALGDPSESSLTDKRNEDINKFEELLRKHYSYKSTDYYISKLPAPSGDSETDADGKFSIQIPKTGEWVLEATAQRTVGDKTEDYFWLIKISSDQLAAGQVMLSNDNLASNHDSNGSNITDALTKTEMESTIAHERSSAWWGQ